jgi:hypothetical protein
MTAVPDDIPERLVYTPMGVGKFRNADLERDGFRWGWSGPEGKLVEIVYLRPNGDTGTVIADVESLLDMKVVMRDGTPVCCVTFKLLKTIKAPVDLYGATVPIDGIKEDRMKETVGRLLTHFLRRTYGKVSAVDEIAAELP